MHHEILKYCQCTSEKPGKVLENLIVLCVGMQFLIRMAPSLPPESMGDGTASSSPHPSLTDPLALVNATWAFEVFIDVGSFPLTLQLLRPLFVQHFLHWFILPQPGMSFAHTSSWQYLHVCYRTAAHILIMLCMRSLADQQGRGGLVPCLGIVNMSLSWQQNLEQATSPSGHVNLAAF